MLKKIFKKSNLHILVALIFLVATCVLEHKLEGKSLYIISMTIFGYIVVDLFKVIFAEESPTKEQVDEVISHNSEIKAFLVQSEQERRNEFLQKTYNIDNEQEIKAAIENDSASDKAKALELLNQNIQSNEENMAKNYFYAAKLLSFSADKSKEDLESALSNINKAYILEPYNWEYVKESLFLLNKQNKLDNILKFYNSLIDNFEKVEDYKEFDKWHLYLIGEIHYVFKRFYKAQEIFKFLFETAENNHPAKTFEKLQFIQALAQVYLVNADFSRAIYLHDQALAYLDDTHPLACGCKLKEYARYTWNEELLNFWYLKGRCLLLKKDNELAKEYLEKILDEMYIDFYVNDFTKFIIFQAKSCLSLIAIKSDKILLDLFKAQQEKININVENIFNNELKQLAHDLSLNKKNEEAQYCLSLIAPKKSI